MKPEEPQPLAARAAVRALGASKIRELVNAGFGRKDVLPFWVGEPDEPTPDFIRKAGIASIEAGEVFYSHNLGLHRLREALAAYVSGLHRPTTAAEIAVTSAGVNALMLVSQLLLDPGDRVVEVVPLWPNLQEIPRILGATVSTVPLQFSRDGWRLDLERLLGELKPGTRALYLNSPNNPTGWTISREAQRAILEHCRRHGIWIFADDAYERLYYGGGADAAAAGKGAAGDGREAAGAGKEAAGAGKEAAGAGKAAASAVKHATAGAGVAPSFLDLAEAGERVISTNTFSKSWLMTGWRLGWAVVPAALEADLGKLIEYNTSCAPVFVQRAGIAAVTQGEPVIAHTLARFRKARDFLVGELRALPGVEVALPSGTMYAFFRVQGVTDSLAFCKKLVAGYGLGLAPGAAFGPQGEGFVRWCFAAGEDKLAEGVARLKKALEEGTR